MSKIIVVGSSNTDLVIKAENLPAPGETILGGDFYQNPGGKGANQAVAAARLGGDVSLICKLGKDAFGEQSKLNFDKDGIDTSCLLFDDEKPSGVALITVDKKGENCIVVASGANSNLLPTDLVKFSDIIENASIVLIQLEIPLETVEFVTSIAASTGVKVILNPAPARPLPDSLLKNISLITPNEIEAEMLSGIKIQDTESAMEAAKNIHDRGVSTVIITMGSEGAFVYDGKTYTRIPATPVVPLDTTAAGDVFNGALAVALAEGKDINDATRFACHAAAISVTRIGAQSSAPYISEIESTFKA
jgi:ribokinase